MVMQHTDPFVVVKNTWVEDDITMKMDDGCKLKLFTRLSHFMVIAIEAQCFKLSEDLSIS